MPTEGNLNRVSSPGLDRELAALESQGSGIAANRIHRPEAEVEISQQHEGVIQSSPDLNMAPPFQLSNPPPAGWEFEQAAPITAEASRAEYVGKTDPNDEAVSVAEVTKLLTEHFAHQMLSRDPDLAAFKKQVIGAFKHLGLDTRKHFGV
jgi:hypothetical protein